MREYLENICNNAAIASKTLSSSSGDIRNMALSIMAEKLIANKDYILQENKKDIEMAQNNGIRKSMIDRLLLNEDRIDSIANSIIKVKSLPDPIGSGEVSVRPNGLSIRKIHVPIGTIGIIYEARPNVTVDAAALCIKSGNTVVLKGGSDAINSNIALTNILRNAIAESGLDKNCINIIENTSRETTIELMKLRGFIDLLIPRGSKGLIRSVVENATVPVIETGAGNCHIYVDDTADLNLALNIVYNAKTSRPSVCNAAETLLVHDSIANTFLPMIKEKLNEVELRGCSKTCSMINCTPATDDDWDTEYNDYILSVKVVNSIKEAVDHINRHNTQHSESIITSSLSNASYFQTNVDAAAVYVNASTRFTDGEEFGLGAEIGISTQKLHARGPMGLNELTTIKYLINGDGQIR